MAIDGVRLNVEPNTPPMMWETFIAEKGPFSVAIDGYVHGGPRRDLTLPAENFNHHEEVDRRATNATCVQMLDAIREGFFKTFQKDGSPFADFYANDCDQDVITTWYLASHPYHAKNVTNPLLNGLVFVEGKLDASAGAYGFDPDLELMGTIAWIFEPYTRFRRSGEINKRNASDFIAVITDSSHRIDQYMLGRAKSIKLDKKYKPIVEKDRFIVVEEIGEHARIGLFSDGKDAFVAAQQIDDKTWRYSIGKRSEYIPFPVEEIMAYLNQIDPNVDEANRWGGGDTIGGSPRSRGSGLSPEELAKAVDDFLKAKQL